MASTGNLRYWRELLPDIQQLPLTNPYHKLIEDVKQHYSDIRVQTMLTNIIKNPIETARGCKNADHGIALRGP